MTKKAFCGAIPDNLFYDPRYDMWVHRENGEVVIGATSVGIFRAGEIIAFTAKPLGAKIANGRGLGTVECAKTVLAVHAPLGFELIAVNTAAEERPDLINRDPYGTGWMVRGRPENWDVDRAGLIDAEAYRRHVLAAEPDAEFL